MIATASGHLPVSRDQWGLVFQKSSRFREHQNAD
jgi:hypothetical protein